MDKGMSAPRLMRRVASGSRRRSPSVRVRSLCSVRPLVSAILGHESDGAVLAEVYNSFAEGFDTADVKEVKALLCELSE
jgi:hypothetical protein